MKTQVVKVVTLQDFLNRIKDNNRVINIIPHTYVLNKIRQITDAQILENVLVIYQPT